MQLACTAFVVTLVAIFNVSLAGAANEAAIATTGRYSALQTLETVATSPPEASVSILAQLAQQVGTSDETLRAQGSQPPPPLNSKDVEDMADATLDQLFHEGKEHSASLLSPKFASRKQVDDKYIAESKAEAAAQPSSPASETSITKISPLDLESAVTGLVNGNQSLAAKPSVKKIKELITKTMMPAVNDGHKADQNELRLLAKHVGDCGDSMKAQGGKVRAYEKKYKTYSKLHKRCRNDEAIKYMSKKNCFREEAEKKKIKELRCNFYASTSRRVGDGNRNRQIVKRAGGESTETYARRITGTVCGQAGGKGREGHGKRSMLDDLLDAKAKCQDAVKAYSTSKKRCARMQKEYTARKAKCNSLQMAMDSAACKSAVHAKDSCESYAECYKGKSEAFETAKKTIQQEEKDRKAEWRGLKRIGCIINAFLDEKVEDSELKACKEKTHDTNHLVITYPTIPKFKTCSVPLKYPSSPEYKKAEFAGLPSVAKGKESDECAGVQEISTTPSPGSPKGCKCDRVTLNGPYSAGPMVKCINCQRVSRSVEKNSCPIGTKLFSPRSRSDWQTFIGSAKPLRAPHFIIDVTRPQNSCGGCTRHAMNSGNSQQKSWRTSDGSPWWLRSTRYNEPNGDYHANCYLDLWHTPKDPNAITFNDGSCSYSSKSYYCQRKAYVTKPRKGSPRSCSCHRVDLVAAYSAKFLVRCEQCLTVYKSTQKNSCPEGMKIFSPASRGDWKTFLASAKPLRAPHWIIDVTRPSNGCGGCTRSPMNSRNTRQVTWRTSDGSSWWLRSTRYTEPNGDYRANCFLDIWRVPANENDVRFNDWNCKYHSRSYYCQPSKKKKKR